MELGKTVPRGRTGDAERREVGWYEEEARGLHGLQSGEQRMVERLPTGTHRPS